MYYRHKYVDLKQIADWGLIVEINKKILNPLGLMLIYDPVSGISDTILVEDSFKWQYDKETLNDANKRLKLFKKNRKQIFEKIPYK